MATLPVGTYGVRAVSAGEGVVIAKSTGTPEEMIIDFGLNPQPIGLPTTPIVVSDQIVVNFYTAKRMLLALQATIQRHEQAFGNIEIDVQKRVKQ